ncbi:MULTISPECIES: 3-oxoadipate enol-lactonase [Amycolatopsis]|uniref:3-oxoadipate enol-lactonase n=1 Tax=Amycolatopsis echigonensis TaxID=2576905 RepID=A0A2N3WN98_9PSEU|nr:MULTISPECIES: 3-oxoadipate enol-lactonase [Amycolatopsis]PKV95339.1 3-oxoadipate enol-lactonase [Amycolatopsis niigatensis]
MNESIVVHHAVTGREDGPVVVLSNSLGTTMAMWDANLAELEKRFRVVRYDTRGHGGSPVPSGPYTIDDLADDIVALLERLGVRSAHVVGLSLGGMTAMRLAARRPDLVDRMVLLCTSPYLEPSSAWRDRAELVRAEGTQAVDAAVVARWYTAAHLEAHPEVKAAGAAMVAATPAEGYASCCEAIAAMDLRPDLASITAPTLAVAGAEDPATPPPHLQQIADGVARGRLLVVDKSAHLANAERPEIVTPAILAHLGAAQ